MQLQLSPAGRKYGFFPSKPDHRDYGITGLSIIFSRPSNVDLEQWCGPVKDQGQLGACTAFAGTGNREWLLRKFEGKSDILSPLFLYYKEREYDGSLSEGDTGSTGRTSCIVQQKFGICLESVDPYKISEFQRTPTSAQLSDALTRKAGAYHAILNVQDMKSCLASSYPFTIGFTVYGSFESEQVAESGLMPVPDRTKEQILGGHEVFVIGYDDNKVCPRTTSPGAFKVRNSWGKGWGLSGNFWMPYEVAASDILLESRIQHLGKPW